MTAAAIRAALASPRRVLGSAQRPLGAPNASRGTTDAPEESSTPSGRLFSNQPRIQPPPIGCWDCSKHMPRQIRGGVVVHIAGNETRNCEDEG